MPHPDPEPRHMSREPSDKKLHMHQRPLLLPAEDQEGGVRGRGQSRSTQPVTSRCIYPVTTLLSPEGGPCRPTGT